MNLEVPDNLFEFPKQDTPEAAGKHLAEIFQGFEQKSQAPSSKLGEIIEEVITGVEEGRISKEEMVKGFREIKKAVTVLDQQLDQLLASGAAIAKETMIRRLLHNRELDIVYAAFFAAIGRLEEAKEHERKADFITKTLEVAGVDIESYEKK